MLRKSLLWVGLSILILVGCSNEQVTDGKVEPDPDAEAYIAEIEDDRALVETCYYTIEDDTELVKQGGSEISSADLQVGMKVQVWSNGVAAESYPCQTKAVKLIVLTNDDSKKEQEAVRAIMELASSQYEKPIILLESLVTEDKNGFEATLQVLHETDEEVKVYYDFKTKQATIR